MRRHSRVPLLLLALSATVALVAGTAAPADNWPNWRGPANDGTAAGAPPIEWAEGKNVAWKTALPGLGSATPIVWGNRIYVLSAVDSAAGAGSIDWVVIAYDVADGTEVWRHVARTQVPYAGKQQSNSYASASAITDGAHIWAFFGSYGLHCLDMDGEVVWELDFGAMETRRSFGEGASPALHGDAIVVVWDQEPQSWIGAFDKSSGDELWRVDRDEPTTWATPFIVEFEGTTQVITAGTNRVRSYDLADGALLWEGPGLTLNSIPSPVYADGIVYLAAGYRGSALMAVDLRTAAGKIDDTEAIRWRIERDTPYVPSPLLVDDIIYYVKSNNAILSAVQASTGDLLFGPQRLDGVREIYASPTAANGYIYILGRDGGATVLRQGPTYEVVAQNSLDDGFDASPAIVGDVMYLRGRGALYKIEAATE
jgi:outer membrane protein assembly factor BamB